MDQIWIVEHRFNNGDQSVIGYASTPEKAKQLAREHYGQPLPFKPAYASYRATGGKHFYSVYAELIDKLTHDATSRAPVHMWEDA